MSPSHFKDYVLTLEPTGHQSESIKQSINCKKKDSLPSQRYGSAASTPQRSSPLWLTQKTVCRFRVKEKRWKGTESKPPFKHLYCSPSWDLSELWKVSSGLQPAEETDPIGASSNLRSGSINFILKILLLDLNIYSTTSRPHDDSRPVVIISWLKAPEIQTHSTPGKAQGEPWHAGGWVTLWWMAKWWNTEVPWHPPPPEQIVWLPLRRTECITFTTSGLGKMSAWCSKIAASAARRWLLFRSAPPVLTISCLLLNKGS